MDKENNEENTKDNFKYFFCNWCLQLSVWIFDGLIISNIILYGHIAIIENNSLVNSLVGIYAFCNYIVYLFINIFASPLFWILKNQKTEKEMIDKIESLINDNSFSNSTISYECYHFLKQNEKRSENFKYVSQKNNKTKVITKSGSITYNFLSMRDISGNIYLKTLDYSNLRLKVDISVEMDEETKKDFEDTKEQYFADCKNSDEFFNPKINHNYEKNRYSEEYLVKIKGGKC